MSPRIASASSSWCAVWACRQPANATARNEEQAVLLAREVGYPLVVRPSYVLGGRAMEIVFNEDDLRAYMAHAVQVSNDSPVLLDRFLDVAIEVDVDAVCDGEDVLIGGIMEHVEQAGVHSGDSSCSLPPNSLSAELQDELRAQTRKLARALNVIGLMNVQFAIQNGIGLRARGQSARLAHRAVRVEGDRGADRQDRRARHDRAASCASSGVLAERVPKYYSVKEAVFPFMKFPEADPILGPEMKSTGEVMGTGRTFGEAYAKSQTASGVVLPRSGCCLISVRERDKAGAVPLARRLIAHGFNLVATTGTAATLKAAGIECRRVNKVREGRPHIVDMIKNDEIDLIVNTTEGKQAILESNSIRREAVHRRVTYYTTLAAALATCEALDHLDEVDVNRLQDLHQRGRRAGRGRAARGTSAHEALADDAARRRAAAHRAQAAEVGGSAARHQGDRRGAQSRRSVRERRVSRGARAAGLHRGPDHGDRVAAGGGGDHRCRQPAAHRHAWCSAPRSSSRIRTRASAVTYQIVGEDEADIRGGRISITSPIARALIGKSAGRRRRGGRPGQDPQLRDRLGASTSEALVRASRLSGSGNACDELRVAPGTAPRRGRCASTSALPVGAHQLGEQRIARGAIGRLAGAA